MIICEKIEKQKYLLINKSLRLIGGFDKHVRLCIAIWI